MRVKTGYLDRQSNSLDEALEIIARSCQREEAGLRRSSGQRRGDLSRAGATWNTARCRHRPDFGPRSGEWLLPKGWTLERWASGRENDPKEVERAARRSMAEQVSAMLDLHKSGVPTFDYGNNIRQMAKDEGIADAFGFPGFVPAYIRPAVLPRDRPVSMGCTLRRSRGHLPNRREGESALARQQAPARLARSGS